MNWLPRTACAAILLSLPLVPPSGARGEEEKLPAIWEIMQQAHSCGNNSLARIRMQLSQDDPNWAILENRSEDLMRLGRQLGRNTPPRGTRESWERLTNIYVAHATLLADAAQKEERDTVLVHLRQLGGMCNTCHQAHRR